MKIHPKNYSQEGWGPLVLNGFNPLFLTLTGALTRASALTNGLFRLSPCRSVFSEAEDRESPMSSVRQALCERRQLEETLGLPSGDLATHHFTSDVALFRLPSCVHP